MDKSTSSDSSAQEIPPRPQPLVVIPERIPESLKALKQFVVWRYFWIADRQIWDKPPLNARTGNLASSTNPGTWGTFTHAITSYASGLFDGIGLVLCKKNHIVGVDLDHCRNTDTGDIESWAWEIMRELNTYTEISPSGTGLRFLAEGTLPGKGRKKGAIELYDNARYLTLTGQHVEGTPTSIEPRQEAVNALLVRVFGSSQTEPNPPNPQPNGISSRFEDNEILAKACAARNGEKFTRLWNGSTADYTRNGNAGHNEADLALCALIAFWTRDPEQLDRLFRRSGLMRPKWDESRGGETYGAMTIRKALEFQGEAWHAQGIDDEIDISSTENNNVSDQDQTDAGAGDEQPPSEHRDAQDAQQQSQHQQSPPGGSQRRSASKGKVILNGRKQLISCQHNALWWLETHGYAPKIRLDTFTQQIQGDGTLLIDEVIIEFVRLIEAKTLIRWAQAHVQSALVSLGTRQGHSSLVTWLDSLTWDQEARLDNFFIETCEAEENDYTRACAKVFFLQAVARAYRPGCKADLVVTLIGDQGIGKSKVLSQLVPDLSWYTDDLGGDLYERKVAEGLQGKWLIEFSEFARINRSTIDMTKAFLSRQVDHYRPAYGHIAKDFPRQCVFVGTTNNPLPLQDLENRRFMPIRCPRIMIDVTPERRDQLWAEAVYRYKAGESWWITEHALIETAKEKQQEARQHDEWEDILREALVGRTTISMEDAAKKLAIPIDRLDRGTQTRIGLALKAIGLTRKRDGKALRPYFWERSP
jgi:putative DNA primase/helicase